MKDVLKRLAELTFRCEECGREVKAGDVAHIYLLTGRRVCHRCHQAGKGGKRG